MPQKTEETEEGTGLAAGMLYVNTHHTRLAEAYEISLAMIKLLMSCTRSSGVWRRSPWCANDNFPAQAQSSKQELSFVDRRRKSSEKWTKFYQATNLGATKRLEDGMILL